MIRLAGFSRGALNVVLFEAIEAINKSGGWIKDHHSFSNKMATIAFEISAQKVELLIDELSASGVKVEIPSSNSSIKTGDIDASLTITFLTEGLEMHRPVPAF